jgi:hypothetical protein
MLRLSFAVEDANGPRQVDVGPASLVAWERKTGRKVSQFAEGIGAEDMAWLVWHADKRAGNTTIRLRGVPRDHRRPDEGNLPKARRTRVRPPTDTRDRRGHASRPVPRGPDRRAELDTLVDILKAR